MGYSAQEAALRPSPVTPSSDDIVQQAYTLGGESRYQVSPQEALQWVERNMEGQPLEHKAAWIEARNRVAARASNRAPSYNR